MIKCYLLSAGFVSFFQGQHRLFVDARPQKMGNSNRTWITILKSNCVPCFILDFLPPPMKLLEGNVFISVCLSVYNMGPTWTLPMMHLISLYRPPSHQTWDHQTWDPLPQPPPNTHRHKIWDLPGPGPLLVTSGGHHLIPVPTSFKGPGVTFGGGYWTMYSWRKRAVRIFSFLLECFLSINVIVLVTEASPELVKQKTLRKSYSISLTPRQKTDRPSPSEVKGCLL